MRKSPARRLPAWTRLVALAAVPAVIVPLGGEGRTAGFITTGRAAVAIHRFTSDQSGAPQVEESVAACRSDPRLVLGASDDGRALSEPARGVVSWEMSDRGGSLGKDGPLPPVTIDGTAARSTADPAVAVGPTPGCGLYAATLIGTGTPGDTNGSLVSAVGGFYSPRRVMTGHCQETRCWPVARAIAIAPHGRFYDKEWLAVGRSGAAGTVVWFVWTDRPASDPAAGVALAERCTADLSVCTKPERLSDAGDDDPEFTGVVVGPSGVTYFLWRSLADPGGSSEPGGASGASGSGNGPVMTIKMRTAQPGDTTLGKTHIVAVDSHVMPLGGRLNGNDFLRADAYPKLDVATLPGGRERLFVVWDSCSSRVGTVCEGSRILLTWSDDAGLRWAGPVVVTPSSPGNRYFPTLSADPVTHRLAISYYSTELDPRYDSGQDVFTEIWDTARPHRLARYRITPRTDNPGADPGFPQTFIGSYFQITAVDGIVYHHFNANYLRQRLGRKGLPVPQEDNYLAVLRYTTRSRSDGP